MHWIRWVIVTIAAFVALAGGVAHACPMCNQSIAEEALMPRAYMYSILFMLGMPAMVFSCLGIAIFRKFQAHHQEQAATAPPADLPVGDATARELVGV